MYCFWNSRVASARGRSSDKGPAELASGERMNAKSAASLLYDYYNPEASSEVGPLKWTVK